MTNFRAKVMVQKVTEHGDAIEVIANPVCSCKPYGPNGESEDNTFARYTPSGEIKLWINNPDLKDKIKVEQKFYVDFTLVNFDEAE